MGTDIHGVWQRRTEKNWEDVESNYDQSQHYLLFAWLGDVRNGFGFAGIATHDRIEPLAPHRGLPDDFKVDDENHPISDIKYMEPWRRKYHEDGEALEVWMGDHSHSWVLSSEVLAATPPIILRTGIISIKQFDGWNGTDQPEDGWCGGISGLNVVLAESPSEVRDDTTHVRIEWFENTADTLKYFIDEVRRLHDLYGEVRFVFGFDN